MKSVKVSNIFDRVILGIVTWNDIDAKQIQAQKVSKEMFSIQSQREI